MGLEVKHKKKKRKKILDKPKLLISATAVNPYYITHVSQTISQKNTTQRKTKVQVTINYHVHSKNYKLSTKVNRQQPTVMQHILFFFKLSI